MSANRHLLHKSRLAEFQAWLGSRGIDSRPGKGDYEVLQVLRNDGHWFKLYRREHMPEHLTVQGPLVQLVREFIHETRDMRDGSTPGWTTDCPPGSHPALYPGTRPPWEL